MLVAAAAAVVAVGGLGVARTALAEEAPAAPAVTAVDPLQPPPNHEIALQATVQSGTGFQVYRCAAGAWTFERPVARLTEVGSARVIRHYGERDAAGVMVPHWQYGDGSIVRSVGKLAEAPSRNPNSIPQLLLRTQGQGPGQFGGVRFIQRLDTIGGVAPTRACTGSEIAQVPYRARYVFWVQTIR